MDIKKIKLSELLPDDQNANKGTDRGREALEASLRKYGFGRSILLDKQGRIIAGNKTHEIASEIGLEDVLIVQVDGRQVVAVQRTDLDLDDPMARELAIADNRVGELDLSWDADILQQLSDLDGVDITAFWNQEELDALLSEIGKEKEEFVEQNEDKGAADPNQVIPRDGVELGSIWQLGRHRIMCADSTVEANVKALLGDRFGDVGMVWADPPFGIDLKPQRGLTKAIANDRQWEAKDVWSAFIPVLFGVMRDNTTAFLCQGWSEFDWTLPIVRKHFTVKNKIVWHKNQIGIGYYLRPQHEDILYCWKGQPEKPAIAISNVWQMARLNAPEHSCEKPIDLPLKAMEFASLPNDLIFDPFLGVAPSIIAAQKMEGSRTVYGMELSPEYIEVILQRWEKFVGTPAKRIN